MEDIVRKLKTTNDKGRIIELLFDEYGLEIKKIAYLYLRDHKLSEDILQEVFIACFNNLDTFRQDSGYKTWLIRITINKCKDALKSWSFRNLIYKGKIDYKPIERNTPETAIISKLSDLYLAEQVLILPIKFREVIILYYYEELSIEEISQVLNINVNTVKSRLHRARAKLKDNLKGSESEWKID